MSDWNSTTPQPSAGTTPLASLPSPPPTLPLWAKVVYYIAETIAIGVSFAHFDWGSPFNSTDTAEGEQAGTWRRYVSKWEDTSSSQTADDQYYTVDVVNITNGQVDGTWNDTDYNNVQQLLNTYNGLIASSICNRYQNTQIAAYIMGFTPYSNPKPFAKSGSPVKVWAVTHTGAGGSTGAPQVCTTVTEETPVRKHWGRMYLPTLGGSTIDVNGRLQVANVDAIAQAAHDTYGALMNNQYFPVVCTTQSEKQPLRALQTVTGVRVDDVVDVHRSRRHKFAAHRKILPLVTQASQQPI